MISKAQKWINKYYTHTPKWIYDILMTSFYSIKAKKHLFETLELEKKDNVLEIACGTGLNFKYYHKGPKYFGIDINSSMLEKAKKRAKFNDISLIICDAHELPFSDNFFDAAFITYGLSTIPDNYNAMLEIHRVVQSNGLIGILDLTKSKKIMELGGQTESNLPKLMEKIPGKITYRDEMKRSNESEYVLRVN